MERHERCPACRFDASRYTHDDLLGTLRALPPIWRTMTEGLDSAALDARPNAATASALDALAASISALTVASGALGSAGEPAPAEAPTTIEAGIVELVTVVARMNERASTFTPDDWNRSTTAAGRDRDAEWVVADVVHRGTHLARATGRGLHDLGVGAPTQHGSLLQINTSQGGVPKAAIERAAIGERGIIGDRQAERNHHGRPLQALCLWSREVIDALRAEGHPIYAGAAGENLTIAGIDWTTIRPGVRIAIGTELVVDISAFATPCTKNAQWFSDRRFNRILHDSSPGWSRAYAWVVADGSVAAGDPVVVEP